MPRSYILDRNLRYAHGRYFEYDLQGKYYFVFKCTYFEEEDKKLASTIINQLNDHAIAVFNVKLNHSENV